MLTDKDIRKIVKVTASKEDMKEIREEIRGLRESVQGLITAVDNLTHIVNKLSQEYSAITVQIQRHDKWLQKLAKKVGIKLEN